MTSRIVFFLGVLGLTNYAKKGFEWQPFLMYSA